MRNQRLYRIGGCFLLLVAGRIAFSQGAPASWSGWAQCQLTVQTPAYAHQEIQTWNINSLLKDNGSLAIYQGTWSVTGQGWRQDIQGVQATRMQWSVNVPPMDASFVIFVRGSDNQLVIRSYHSQLRSNNAGTAVRQSVVSGLAQAPTQSTIAEYEWQFPTVQDVGTSTNVSGSSSTAITAGIGPMQPAGLPGTAVCRWQFSKGLSPAAISQLTQRVKTLQTSLPPTTQSWVQQQAQATAQLLPPDVSQIEAQVRAQFDPAQGATTNLPPGVDVETLTAIVLTQANDDASQDVRDLLNEVNTQNSTKKQLSDLINQVNQSLLSMGGKMKQICGTPACQSLPAALNQLAVETAQTSQPIQVAASGSLTYEQLQQILRQMQTAQDDLGSLSGDEQLRLQKAMDQEKKLEEMLSDILKKVSDTGGTIVGNTK